MDQTHPTPCSKNTTGTQTIDADHTDKEKDSKPVEGAETDKVFWWRRRDGQDGKGNTRTRQPFNTTKKIAVRFL